MQEIKRMTPRQRQDRQTRAYGELIGITEEVIDSARAALRQTGNARGKDMITELAIAQTRKEIEHLVAQDVPRSRRFSSSAFDSCRSWHEPATCGSAATGIVARRINRSPPYMGRLKSSANFMVLPFFVPFVLAIGGDRPTPIDPHESGGGGRSLDLKTTKRHEAEPASS
jgi:hypothetical protein